MYCVKVNIAFTCLIVVSVVPAESVVYEGLPIVLSAEEIAAATKQFNRMVVKRVDNTGIGIIATNPSAVNIIEDILGKWYWAEANKLKGWDLSAVGAFHATIDAFLSKKLDLIAKGSRIVIIVGVGATGGVGLSVVELYLRNGFSVTVIVLPRYKTELIHDAMWQKHFVAITTNFAHTGKITINDFRRLPASIAATTSIRFFSIAVSGKYDGDTVATMQEELTKLLMAEAEALKALLQVLARSLSISQTMTKTVVIESYVGAGYQHPDEVDNKFVLRYQLGETVGQWLTGLQSKGAFIGSFDLPCNTSSERGYFHGSKDGQKKVTMIPNSYIPDFMVLITFPRESLLALEGAGSSNQVQYQFQSCSLIYLTPIVDPLNMNILISYRMWAEVISRPEGLKYDNNEVIAFCEALRKVETAFGSAEGFLKLTVPKTVVKSVARTAGIVRPIGTAKNVFRGDTYVTKDIKEFNLEKETFINFDHYALLFADKSVTQTKIKKLESFDF